MILYIYLDNKIIDINKIDNYIEQGYYLCFCGVINNHWIYELIKNER